MKATLLALALTLGAGAASASTTWNMAAEQPDNNYMTIVAREFAQDAQKGTKGELDIKIHSNAVLFKRPEVKRAVQTGQVQLGDVVISILANEDPVFEVDTIPMLARSFPQAKKLWSVSRQSVEQKLLKQGVRVLYALPWPPQSLVTKQPVQSMDDLKSVRVRSYSATLSRMIELMGASPTIVSTGEIPQAFSTGVISALITSPITAADSQAWEYARHYYDIQAFIPKNFMLMNERAFQRLSPASQKAVLEAAARAEEKGWRMAEQLTDKHVSLLREKGMTVAMPPASVDSALTKIGATMVDEWVRKGGNEAQSLVDAYRK